MIFAKHTTTSELAERFDEFGDSFTEKIDEIGQLKNIFKKINAQDHLTYEDIAEIEEENFPHDSTYGLFRLCNLYGDLYEILSEEDTLNKKSSLPAYLYLASVYGAKISKKLDGSVTHVIIENTEHLTDFNKLNRFRSKKFRLVKREWIDECVKQKKLLDELNFRP